MGDTASRRHRALQQEAALIPVVPSGIQTRNAAKPPFSSGIRQSCLCMNFGFKGAAAGVRESYGVGVPSTRTNMPFDISS